MNQWRQLTAKRRKDLLAPFAQGGARSGTEVSAQKIANQINLETGAGVTRNAVIGSMRRFGLTLPLSVLHKRDHAKERVKNTKARDRRAPRRLNVLKKKNVREIPVAVEIEDINPSNVRFVDTTNHNCMYPVSGAPGPDMVCCGVKRHNGSSYCEKHHKLTHVPPSRRVKRKQRSGFPNLVRGCGR